MEAFFHTHKQAYSLIAERCWTFTQNKTHSQFHQTKIYILYLYNKLQSGNVHRGVCTLTVKH